MKSIKNTMFALMLGLTAFTMPAQTAGTIYTSTATYNSLATFTTNMYGGCTASPANPIISGLGANFGYYLGSTWSSTGAFWTSNNTLISSGFSNGSSGAINMAAKDTGVYVVGFRSSPSTSNYTYQSIYVTVCPAVIPTPSASFTQNALTVCVGNSVSFTNTSISYSAQTTFVNYQTKIWPSKYTWIINGPSNATVVASPGATTQPGSLGTPLSYTFTLPGTYTVTLNATNWSGPNNASSVITKTITVNPSPTVSVSNVTVCAGATVSLTASGASTYTWSTGTTTIAPTTNTVVTVSGSASGCVSNTASLTISVNANPTVSATSQTICAGNSVTLSASGASTYVWSNGQVVSPSSTASYTVVGTNSNGCSGSAISTINVNQLPNVSISGGSTVCANVNLSLIASGANTYVWSNNSVNSSTTYSNSVPGSYTVGVTGTDANMCENTAVVTIDVSDCATGIAENHLNKIKLYPNPSNGEFYVDAENGNVQVYSLTGQLISSTELNGKTAIHVELPGIYVIKLVVDGKIYSSKLINQ